MTKSKEYIQELRRLVGTRPIIMVGAAVLILNAKEQLLLIRRTDNGCWGIPGGAMDLGETIEETVSRETREETGLIVGEMKLFDVFSGPKLFYQYADGNQVHNVSVVYVTSDVSGEISIDPKEHDGYSYFDIESLPDSISPPVKPVFERLCQVWKARKT